MTAWLEKVWLYGGWFYLSLGASILVASLSPAKAKWLKTGALILALGWAGWLYGGTVSQLPQALHRLTLPSGEKKDVMTFGQVPFWEELDRVLPADASGCLLASWDVPTHFLQQRLYPRRFKVVIDQKDLQGCPYVISQFKTYDLPGYAPVLVVKDNVLYQRQ
jgi:hypothetical protein